jgi:REP element-mobilizing transposase RayT
MPGAILPIHVNRRDSRDLDDVSHLATGRPARALFDLYGRLIEQGHKLNMPDKETHRRSLELAKEPERVLTPGDQKIVANTIASVLRNELEGRVSVYAGAIERTHVHLLLGETNISIDRIVGIIKSRTSSAVIARGTEPNRTRTWTNGYWKVFFFDLLAIPTVQNYIELHNERRGLPRVPYCWIKPFV